MEGLFVNIIKHYYWFLVAIAASLMFGAKDVSSVLILCVAAATLICMSTIRWKLFDGLVFTFLMYSLVSYFFVEFTYPLRLYYLGIRSQIVPILFYFIARSDKFKMDEFFENFRRPLFFAMICGVYFYFFQPYFYVSYKAEVIWNNFDSDVRANCCTNLHECLLFGPILILLGTRRCSYLCIRQKKLSWIIAIVNLTCFALR